MSTGDLRSNDKSELSMRKIGTHSAIHTQPTTYVRARNITCLLARIRIMREGLKDEKRIMNVGVEFQEREKDVDIYISPKKRSESINGGSCSHSMSTNPDDVSNSNDPPHALSSHRIIFFFLFISLFLSLGVELNKIPISVFVPQMENIGSILFYTVACFKMKRATTTMDAKCNIPRQN